jgi:hypothetical protein
MEEHKTVLNPTLEQILTADREIRGTAATWCAGKR